MIGNETDEIYEKLFWISFTKLSKRFRRINEWLKNKKATINPKNNDDNCFQYALTVVLNHQNNGKNPQRISKIKPFIDQYNWKEIDFPSEKRLEKFWTKK